MRRINSRLVHVEHIHALDMAAWVFGQKKNQKKKKLIVTRQDMYDQK